MTQAVLYHKVDSIYDDITGKQYHFPKQYLKRMEQTVGDWIVYYGPMPRSKGSFYFGVARVKNITADSKIENHFYAHLTDYIDFDRWVHYMENGGYEQRMVLPDGRPNGGLTVNAVRLLEPSEFQAIVTAGLANPDEWPDRVDAPQDTDHVPAEPGFGETPQAPFFGPEVNRPIIPQLLNRRFRDAKFKQNIRRVYDRTCAFTGLRLINGGGRPEVEAAHIVPVEHGGSDSIQNGIALSGTVHWMFDRGLLCMQDDYTITPSRHLNYDVSHLLHKDMKARVPEVAHQRPHPDCLKWHRERIFKQ
ncbi:HNH endonuclease [Pannonibacter phragmitetus]|uniref:HNH endonuclease n=1 Tax=Pannonibacter phragmitetus TaxID=121719 RepID=UPI003D2F0153